MEKCTKGLPGPAVFAFSFLATLLFFILFPSPSFGPDSSSYYSTTMLLLGNLEPQLGFIYRTPGYSWLLILTGVMRFETIYGLLALQFLMAMLMPVLIYYTVKLVQPPAAVFSALAAIVSCVPFGYMKAVLTDTPITFFNLLSIFLAVLYLKKQKIRYFYATVLAVAVMMFLRPSSHLMYLCFLVIFLTIKPKRILHLILGTGLIFLCALGIQAHREFAYKGKTYSNLYTAEKLVFYNLYNTYLLEAPPGQTPFKASTGPATARWLTVLRDYLEKHPQYISGGPYMGKFKSAGEVIQSMQTDPNTVNSWYAIIFTDDALGLKQSNELFRAVVLELLAYDSGPAVRCFFRTLKGFFMGPPALFLHEPTRWQPISYVLTEGPTQPIYQQSLPPALFKSLQMDIFQPWIQPMRDSFLGRWTDYANRLRPVIFWIWFLGLPFLLRRSETRWFSLLCAMVLLYSALIVAVFAVPIPRYNLHIFLVEVMLSSLSLSIAVPVLKRWILSRFSKAGTHAA